MMASQSYAERVESIIRAWPQWSPAERRRMDDIVNEIMDHVRSGNGNKFVASFCKNILEPKLRLTVVQATCPECGHYGDCTVVGERCHCSECDHGFRPE